MLPVGILCPGNLSNLATVVWLCTARGMHGRLGLHSGERKALCTCSEALPFIIPSGVPGSNSCHWLFHKTPLMLSFGFNEAMLTPPFTWLEISIYLCRVGGGCDTNVARLTSSEVLCLGGDYLAGGVGAYKRLGDETSGETCTGLVSVSFFLLKVQCKCLDCCLASQGSLLKPASGTGAGEHTLGQRKPTLCWSYTNPLLWSYADI